MAKYSPRITRAKGGIGSGVGIKHVANKGSRQARLPSRAAVNMLTGKGDPFKKMGPMDLGQLSNLSPSGAGAVQTPTPSIMNMGQQPQVEPALPPPSGISDDDVA
jgi:hypothetical protein